MSVGKRPCLDNIRNEGDGNASPPTLALLQTQINTLQSQLTRARSMRSLELKSFGMNEERLKRQIADCQLEIEQLREINDTMKQEMNQMEDEMNNLFVKARGSKDDVAVNLLGGGDAEVECDVVGAPAHASDYRNGSWICTAKARNQQYVCKVKGCKKQVRSCCKCNLGYWLCTKHIIEHAINKSKGREY